MRFASADQAEQALTDARREAFANCPTPKEVGPRHARRGEFEVDPLPQESRFDEGWFLSFDQTPSRGPSDSFVYYATRTANVVVVIETMHGSLRYVLGQAMERTGRPMNAPKNATMSRNTCHRCRGTSTPSGRQDLNLIDPQSSALPSCATSRCPAKAQQH